MKDASLNELEERLMHQELAIDALNQAVARQDRLIDTLSDEISQLRQLLQELRPSPLGADTGHEPPPHY